MAAVHLSIQDSSQLAPKQLGDVEYPLTENKPGLYIFLLISLILCASFYPVAGNLKKDFLQGFDLLAAVLIFSKVPNLACE